MPKLKEYDGGRIWGCVEYDDPKNFYKTKFYLKEEVDKIISELKNKILKLKRRIPK